MAAPKPVVELTQAEIRKLRALVSNRGGDAEVPVVGTTGTFSGEVAAGSFTGPLTGDVTGDTAGTHTGGVAATSQSNSGTLIETSTVSPSALAAGETVLLTPASATREIVIAASGVWFLCSLAAGTEGQEIWIRNGSAYAGALGHEEGAGYGGAVATDCFNCPDAIPFAMRPGAVVPAKYLSGRWRVFGINVFAPGGFILPQTQAEAEAQIGMTITNFWPAGHSSGKTIVGAPLLDYHMGGRKGVKISSGSGWTGGGTAPGLNSILRVVPFGCTAHDAADNILTGRVVVATGLQSILRINTATDRFAFFLYDTATVVAPDVNKAILDGVVRLGIGQLDRAANLARARVSCRGEVAVASADVASGALLTLSGGAPISVLGGDGATGATADTFVGGAFEIIGAAAAGATTPAKVSHRLGME